METQTMEDIATALTTVVRGEKNIKRTASGAIDKRSKAGRDVATCVVIGQLAQVGFSLLGQLHKKK